MIIGCSSWTIGHGQQWGKSVTRLQEIWRLSLLEKTAFMDLEGLEFSSGVFKTQGKDCDPVGDRFWNRMNFRCSCVIGSESVPSLVHAFVIVEGVLWTGLGNGQIAQFDMETLLPLRKVGRSSEMARSNPYFMLSHFTDTKERSPAWLKAGWKTLWSLAELIFKWDIFRPTSENVHASSADQGVESVRSCFDNTRAPPWKHQLLVDG